MAAALHPAYAPGEDRNKSLVDVASVKVGDLHPAYAPGEDRNVLRIPVELVPRDALHPAYAPGEDRNWGWMSTRPSTSGGACTRRTRRARIATRVDCLH